MNARRSTKVNPKMLGNNCKYPLLYTMRKITFFTMRKSPAIVALVLVIVGWAYALVANLLPDNNQFPRIPTGDGTVGGAIAKILGITDLANYLGDGTVENTNMLSGKTADKFLRAQDICLAPNVWLKTDATGKPVCGANGSILASAIGTINTISGTVTAYRADGTTKVLTGTDPVLEGDIIQTDAGAAITIAFSDLSIIRLDGGSTVSLDSGVTTSGQSIAYAILNNGWLWGRVLTETGGYYIGNNDIVAGVRGTSILYDRNFWTPNPNITPSATGWVIAPMAMWLWQIKIFHSTQTGVTLECRDGSTKFIGTGSYAYLMIPPMGQMCNTIPVAPIIPPFGAVNTTFYTYNDSVANNTTADLNYMVKLLRTGGLSPSKMARIQNEINATRPTNAIEKDQICPDGSGPQRVYWDVFSGSEMWPCRSELAIADYTIGSSNMYFSGGQSVSPWYIDTNVPILSAGTTITDDWHIGSMTCQGSTDFLWGCKSGTVQVNIPSHTLIERLWEFYSVAQYSGTYPQSISSASCKVCSGNDKFTYNTAIYGIKNQSFWSPTTGINITGTDYISYPLPLFPGWASSLAGRTVTIELNSPVPTPTVKNYVLDLWTYKVYKDTSWFFKAQVCSAPTNCGTPVTLNTIPSSATTLPITIPTTPTQLVIGNLKSWTMYDLTLPIWTTIKRVTISNSN